MFSSPLLSLSLSLSLSLPPRLSSFLSKAFSFTNPAHSFFLRRRKSASFGIEEQCVAVAGGYDWHIHQEGDYTEFPPTFWSANLMAEKLYFIV